MNSIRNRLVDAAFQVRDRAFGQLALRPGLPKAQESGGELGFYLLVLESAFGDKSSENILSVFDVGCRNWSYISALADFFPKAELTGIEVDGGRRMVDLYRRKDYVEAYSRMLEESGRKTHCWFGDFRDFNLLPRSPAIFTFFFPFVSADPCLTWGLPERFSDFKSLLIHARLLASDARIVSAHQGEWEAEIARETYGDLRMRFRETILRADQFQGLWPSQHDVHVMSTLV